MTRRHIIIAAGLSAFLSTSALAGSVTYTTLFTGDPRGRLIVTTEGNRVTTDFDYKQNGRGPTIKESLTLNSAGVPVDWAIDGRTTFGNQVAERFRYADGVANWTDTTGPGTAKSKAALYYVDQNGSAIGTALLAKALLADPDRRMDVWPAGSVSLAAMDTRRFEGPAGTIEATTYALTGLGTEPSYITLDQKGEFFAVAAPGFAIVREGYEAVADAPLRALVEKLGAARLADLQRQSAHRFAGPVRIRNVHVFDPAAKARTAAMDVVVMGERIAQVVPAGSPASAGETVIEGNGGTLVPGLVDMHGHVSAESGLANILAGVTTIRDMGNRNALLDTIVAKFDRGEIAGPRIVRSGFIEGKSPFSSVNGLTVATEKEALDAVRWYGARGHWQVKLYNSMKPEWAPALTAEAHRLGMRVAGHVPAFSTAEAMVDAGFDEITHVNQMMLGWVLQPGEDTRTLFRFTAMKRFPALDLDGPLVRGTLAKMVARKVAHEPTVAIHELGLTGEDGKIGAGAVDYIDHLPVSEQRFLKQALFGADTPKDRADYVAAYATIVATLKKMHEAGILLIPGTDLGGAFTLHRELEIFQQFGMTPAEVLARGTLEMAAYMGRDQEHGSIAKGKYADFFLVPGDPTRDFKAVKAIAMVAKGGAVYFPAEVYPKLGIKPFAAAPKVIAAAADPAAPGAAGQ